MMSNIWESLECRSWSMGLAYDSYLLFYEAAEAKHKPLTKEAYVAMCNVFHDEMERDFNDANMA
jgi:hypothetical protein